MWNPPGPGIKPMSPALEGGFLTTGPTRKSCMICFMYPGIYFIIPFLLGYFFVVQSLSSIWLSHPMDCSTPGFPVLHHLSLVKLLSIELVMPSKYLVLFFPRLLLPSVFPSIRVFSNESVLCIRWPEYCSFSTSPSSEYSGLISFKIDWFDLLAIRGTLKNLLQNNSSKASVLWHSAFFIVQLLHPYTTTGKTIALTIWIFVTEVMSLLFNTLSRFVIAFLPRNKHLLISWLQSPSAVMLEPKKLKSVILSTLSSSMCHEVMWS